MARKKRSVTFVCPGWEQALKAWFLHYGFQHNPAALYKLAAEVKSGATTVQQWARQYGLDNTWVGEWAEAVLREWQNQPYLSAALDQAVAPNQPVKIRYPPPPERRTPADTFQFSTTIGQYKYSVQTIPTSKLSLGILMGGSVDGEPDEDWSRFRARMHDQLDLAIKRCRLRVAPKLFPPRSEHEERPQVIQRRRNRMDRALDDYREQATLRGNSRELIVPTDLHKKLEAAAVYFFRQKSSEKMLEELVNKVGAPTTVYRWVKEVVDLLGLRMKPPAPPYGKKRGE